MTFLEPVGEMTSQNNDLKSKERQVPTGDYKIQGLSTWSRCKQALVGIKLSELVKATGRLVEKEGHR